MTTTPRNSSWKVRAIREAVAGGRTGERCARCLRPAPPQESAEFGGWEASGDGQQVICPECVTPAERQAMDEDAMDMTEKVRENRLRRMAARQGLRLEKSRRRDPQAYDYGAYYLVDGPPPQGAGANWRSRTLMSPEQGLTLDQVEEWLTDGER